MRLKILFFVILSQWHQINGGNILAVFLSPTPSHFMMFETILKELANKGHNVDVVSFFPSRKPIDRYHDISLVGTLPIFEGNSNVTNILIRENTLNLILYYGQVTCELLETLQMRNLRNTTKKYDILITETFSSDCSYGWGYYFGIPVVTMTSSVSLPWSNDRMGNPDNPAYIPNYFLSLVPKMSFYERFFNTLSLIVSKFRYNYEVQRHGTKIAKQFFGPDLPDLEDLVYNTSLMLVNSHFSINQARPLVPNVIEVGGVHLKEPKPLNDYFKHLMETNSSGIIYFTLGTVVKSEDLPNEKIQSIFDVLSELTSYKVLWKASKEKFSKNLRIPTNILFEDWMPQLDILCHPNVKLFISHGGLLGIQEAVYCAVPIMGIPFFADQHLNIRNLENKEYAVEVPYDKISKEWLSNAIGELLNNPKYQKNAKRYSKLFKDRPAKPLDTAVYWIEYAMRHQGAPQLKSEGAKLYWFQYHLIDVALVVLLICCCMLYLNYIFVAFLIKSFKSKIKVKTD